MKPLEIDYKATLVKWNTAVTAYRLNMSELSRMSGVTRQHIANILNGSAVPSLILAERIDRAIDGSVERRMQVTKEAMTMLKEDEDVK